MNAIELREFKDIVRECEQLRYENADLRVQVRDLKADLARVNLLNMKKEGDEE